MILELLWGPMSIRLHLRLFSGGSVTQGWQSTLPIIINEGYPQRKTYGYFWDFTLIILQG